MKTELGIHLGARARVARKQMNLTQADVAERLGLAREVYARLERGQMLPSITTLRALCTVLKLPPHEALALDMAFESVPTGRRRKPLPPKPEKEPPALRELKQQLQGMSRSELRLLNMVASAFPHPPRDKQPAPEDAPPTPEEEAAEEELEALEAEENEAETPPRTPRP